jgi:hypothetical protein
MKPDQGLLEAVEGRGAIVAVAAAAIAVVAAAGEVVAAAAIAVAAATVVTIDSDQQNDG